MHWPGMRSGLIRPEGCKLAFAFNPTRADVAHAANVHLRLHNNPIRLET
jgi:hypothetical protein